VQPTKVWPISAGSVAVAEVRRALQALDALVMRPRPQSWTKRGFDMVLSINATASRLASPAWRKCMPTATCRVDTSSSMISCISKSRASG